MSRTITVVLALALALVAAAGEPEVVVDEAVLATDVCAEGQDLDDLMLDAHDVCDVTVRVVTGEDVVPQFTVTTRTAGEQVHGTNYVVTILVGDCALQFRHDVDVASAVPALRYTPDAVLGCGAHDIGCTTSASIPAGPDVAFDCRRRYEESSTGAVAAPVVEGDLVTFTLTAEGAFAALADQAVPGARVAVDFVRVEPDMPYFTNGGSTSFVVCGELNDCTDVAGDVVFGEGFLEISEPE